MRRVRRMSCRPPRSSTSVATHCRRHHRPPRAPTRSSIQPHRRTTARPKRRHHRSSSKPPVLRTVIQPRHQTQTPLPDTGRARPLIRPSLTGLSGQQLQTWRTRTSKTNLHIYDSFLVVLPTHSWLFKLLFAPHILYNVSASSVATGGHVPTLPRPCWVVGFTIHADPKFSLGSGKGWGRWRTDLATDLHSKAFDSCKLSVYIWLMRASPQTPTGALPWTLLGDFRQPDPLCVPSLTSEPGYATGFGHLPSTFCSLK